jgi:RNA polymerase sigma-70 factor (ECF subfamily)
MIVEGITRVLDEQGLASEATEFLALIRPCLTGAYRLAGFLLYDAGEAEDAVQDALERAWNAWPRLRDRTSFGAWFDRIVANACKDRLRARKGIRVVELVEDAAIGGDPFRAALARDEVGRLVGALPLDQQLVVVLRFWRDLPLEEIAVRLDVPLGTVKSRLHYAMRRLRKELDRQNGEVRR